MSSDDLIATETVEERISRFASEKPTKAKLQAFVKELGVGRISKDALVPFTNGESTDAQLTFTLLAAAVAVCQASLASSTLMLRHVQAATNAYNNFADDLSKVSEGKLTQKRLEEIAKNDYKIARVGKKPKEAVLCAPDGSPQSPSIVVAVWKCACNLQKSQALGNSRTLAEKHVEVAKVLLQVFADVYDIDPNSSGAAQAGNVASDDAEGEAEDDAEQQDDEADLASDMETDA